MPHRQLVRVLMLVSVLVLAGCAGGIGGLMGDESLTFTADEVTVAEGAVAGTNFTVASDEEIAFEQEFEVEDRSVAVTMNAHMVHLQRPYRGAPLGHVVVLSLPQIDVLGQNIDVAQQLNPAGLMSRARGSVGELEQNQKIGERSVGILGEQRTVEVYRGTVEQDGQSARVKIYMAAFDEDGNTIVGVGIVPQQASDQQDVMTVFKGIQEG